MTEAKNGKTVFSFKTDPDIKDDTYILKTGVKNANEPEEMFILRSDEIYIPGDVNGDNTVNGIDTALVLKHISGSEQLSPAQINAANLSGGRLTVDILDAVLTEKEYR